MNFTTLSEGHSCNCHRKADENCTDTFARKVCDARELKSRDFKTHHERGLPPESASCDDICGYRGVSVFVWNGNSKTYISEKFSLTFGISPMMKRPKYQLGVFRISEGLGKVKHTPNQKHGVEPYHYDFYKSDEFAVEKLELVDLLPLFTPNV